MALPTNTFATYEAVGNREDLSDVIYRIDPTDTPFMTGVRAREGDRGQSRMADAGARRRRHRQRACSKATTPPPTRPRRRSGSAISARSRTRWRASPARSRRCEHAGRDDELAYQEMLKGLELKRDMETMLVGTNQAKVTGDDADRPQDRFGAVLDQDQHVEGRRRRRSDPAARRHRHPHRRHAARVHRGAAQDRAADRSGPTAASRTSIMMRRLQQAGVLDLHRPRHADRGDQVEEDRRLGRRLRVATSACSRWSPNRFQRARDVLVLQMDMWAVALSQRPQDGRRSRSPRPATRERAPDAVGIRARSAQREGLRRRVRQHHELTAERLTASSRLKGVLRRP